MAGRRNAGARHRAVRDDISEELRDGGEASIRRLRALVNSPDARIALEAAKALADRAYGRPRQEIEATGGPVVTIVLAGWTDKPELCGSPTDEAAVDTARAEDASERVREAMGRLLPPAEEDDRGA